MKVEKNKKMTLDRLAGLMEQGFKRNQEEMAVMVNKSIQGTQDFLVAKIDQLDEKFEGKFEEVNYKLDKIETKLDNHEKTLFEHDQKIDKLEVDMKTVKKALAI